MNILAISDLHGKTSKALDDYLNSNKIDLILIAGDITHFGPTELAKDILNQLSLYDIPVIAIPGNCDPQGIHKQMENSKAVNAHGKSVSIKNVGICGFGGSNPTPFNTPLEFAESEIYNELENIMLQIKNQDIQILLTHAPPYDTCTDLLPSGDHVGSKSVRQIIEKHHPTLNICGHIHESPGIDKIGETTIINPGEFSKGAACLITIEPTKKEVNSKIISL
ncbi:metallophosphoesterase [Methanobacterium alcaliphilum]|uniref:metallophosphoesterase n=1 Tax=Methanobacterium alcaliphilum TaxID=392018 RepID=UPI00200A49A0|nr:metallophosphoesterase [Methanobacterium alcaliphilum]MCK9151273.1 metallophosphoesterase [Methanobacterium alcaliphilum]